MLPTLRGLLIALSIAAAGCCAAEAQSLSTAELQAMRPARAAAQGGDFARAYAEASAITDPLPVKMLRWMDYARPGAPGRFPDIAEFIEKNPDWPGQRALRRHAEEALAAESDAVAGEWLKRYPPVSAAGKIREAEIMLNAGDAAGGAELLRATWIAADFGPLDEKGFLARHAAELRPEDNAKRADRLLWDGQTAAAQRMLPLLSPDWRTLAEARLALAAQSPKADALAARIPAQLRSDSGLVFEQLRSRRKKDMIDAAVQILLAQPGDLVRPTAWWAERQAVARRVLAGGNAELAYRLVEQHGLIEGNAYSDAQFLLGYVALRYMKDPVLAFDHFSRILTRVGTPWAKARAGYWGGRAAQTQGKPELAAKWYAAGADHMATFYGQLAAHALGHEAPPRPVPEPVPETAEILGFNDNELVRAARIFFAWATASAARRFSCTWRIPPRARRRLRCSPLLRRRAGASTSAIAVAKRAIEAGTPLMIHGYPVTTIPSGGTAERSLLFAIMRQESAFEIDAVSRAGARGLMQLMPATASFIANKMQLPFSADRLTVDGAYNVVLGRAYLETLIEDFGGSYELAIAAYNAGPGRVGAMAARLSAIRAPARSTWSTGSR